MTRDRKVGWLVLAAMAGIATLVVLRAERLPGPPPSDDVLYVDAAATLVGGNYSPPSANRPYHHYLRWPVVLPLALLFRILGYGAVAIAAFSALHVLAIGLLSYALVLRLSRDPPLAALAAFAILLVPDDVFPAWHSVLLVRSELPSLAWSMAAFVAIASAGADGKLSLFLAGALLAVAVNATQVTLFSAPAALVLIHSRLAREGRGGLVAFCAAGAVFLAGFAVLTGMVMAVEGVLFGDPLLQTRAVGWWQLLPTRLEDRLAAYLDPGDGSRFAFAFLLRFWRDAPGFAFLAVLAVVSALVPSRKDPGPGRTLVGMACASFFALELVIPFVLEKVYFRFATVPSHLFALAIVVELARRLREARGIATALAPVGASLLAIGLLAQQARSSHHQPWFRYYRDPIGLIRDDAERSGVEPSAVRVFFEKDRVPGLIPWALAADVYGGYAFASERISPGRLPDATADPSYYVQQTTASPAPVGFEEIFYPSPIGEPRPRVYRSAPPRSAEPRTAEDPDRMHIFGPNRSDDLEPRGNGR